MNFGSREKSSSFEDPLGVYDFLRKENQIKKKV